MGWRVGQTTFERVKILVILQTNKFNSELCSTVMAISGLEGGLTVLQSSNRNLFVSLSDSFLG